MLGNLSARGGIGRAALAMAILLGLAGLGTLPAGAQQLEKLKVASVRVSSVGPLVIAKQQGYFKDQGLDVNITLFENLATTALSVVTGSSDLAAGSLGAVIFNLAAQGGLKIIAGQNYAGPKSPSGGFVVTNAAYDAGFTSYAKLAGKRIGINDTGGPTHYGLSLIAQKAGISMNNITLVALQSLTNMHAAFIGNQVDALVAGAPLPGQLLAEHAGHLLGWASDAAPFEVGAIYARTRTINDRPDVLRRFLAAYAKGCADYDAAMTQTDADGKEIQGPDYDEYVKLISDTIAVPEAQLAGMFQSCEPSLKLDLQDLGNQLKFWQSTGAVDISVRLPSLIQPLMN